MSQPSVSVLMAVYNDAKWLGVSIPSILAQTFTDFEFIIVNDGSTDATAEMLTEYAAKDSRIVLIHLPKNSGLPAALNAGLAIARTNLIARHDADDVALPNRLQVLYSYMDAHPDCAIVGSHATAIDGAGSVLGPMGRMPATQEGIRRMLLWGPPFIHPSTMYRRQAVLEVGGYDEALNRVEDYDLWFRMLSQYKGANVPETLMLYRIYPEGYKKKRFKHRLLEARVRWRGLRRMGFPWWHYVYVLKPILVGLLPKDALRWLHLRRWRRLGEAGH